MSKDIQQNGLKVIMLSMLLADAVYDLSGTTLFKNEVKQNANRLVKSIKPYIKQYDDVYKTDPTLAINLLNQVDALLNKIKTKSLVDLTMINQIHDHYKDNIEDWNNLFDIHLTKLKTE